MVFNSVLVATVATVSIDICHSIACFAERIINEQWLDPAICYHLQQLARFALRLWDFFCVPRMPADFYYYSNAHDVEDDSDSDSDSYSNLSSAGGCFSGYDPYSDSHYD